VNNYSSKVSVAHENWYTALHGVKSVIYSRKKKLICYALFNSSTFVLAITQCIEHLMK